MGVAGDKRVNDRDDKRSRAKEKRDGRRRAGDSYSLDLAGYACLVALGDALSRRGGALRIGLTRDFGALALGVYYEDDYATEYVRPTEDLWQAVQEVAAAWLPGGADDLAEAITRLGLEGWLGGR